MRIGSALIFRFLRTRLRLMTSKPVYRFALAPCFAACLVAIGCDSASGPKVLREGTSGDTRPVVIAHRGASYAAPEHTFAAYDLALAQGADYLEQDIQRTSDGVLVVIHDVTLDRTAKGTIANCTGLVGNKTLAQIKTCDVGSWFNTAFPSLARAEYVHARIPTLAEVFERYAGRARFYIELKDVGNYPGIEEDLIRVLREAGITPLETNGRPNLYVQSFDAASLQRVKVLNPAWSLIQLTGTLPSAQLISQVEQIRTYAAGIGPEKSVVTTTLVDAAHKSCLLVHSYTVDDPAEMATLLAAGIDGIFTNRPELGIGAVKTGRASSLPVNCP